MEPIDVHAEFARLIARDQGIDPEEMRALYDRLGLDAIKVVEQADRYFPPGVMNTVLGPMILSFSARLFEIGHARGLKEAAMLLERQP